MAKARKAPADLWKVSIVGHAEVDPRTLTPHPQNWRTHTPAQDAAVVGSLHDLGWIRSVIVNQTTGHVLDGHERLALALAHDVALIPVEYVELPEALEPLALLAIDPTAALAGANAEHLAGLLEQVSTGEAGLQAMLSALAEEHGVVPQDGGSPPAVPPTGRYTEQYGVIVVCADAADQERIYTELHDAGYQCKVVVT